VADTLAPGDRNAQETQREFNNVNRWHPHQQRKAPPGKKAAVTVCNWSVNVPLRETNLTTTTRVYGRCPGTVVVKCSKPSKTSILPAQFHLPPTYVALMRS
jgi:hypothetical protein